MKNIIIFLLLFFSYYFKASICNSLINSTRDSYTFNQQLQDDLINTLKNTKGVRTNIKSEKTQVVNPNANIMFWPQNTPIKKTILDPGDIIRYNGRFYFIYHVSSTPKPSQNKSPIIVKENFRYFLLPLSLLEKVIAKKYLTTKKGKAVFKWGNKRFLIKNTLVLDEKSFAEKIAIYAIINFASSSPEISVTKGIRSASYKSPIYDIIAPNFGMFQNLSSAPVAYIVNDSPFNDLNYPVD